MFASSTAVGHDWTPGYREPRRLKRRPVRVALVTWPGVVFLGVTVVAAACLFADLRQGAGVEGQGDAGWPRRHCAVDRFQFCVERLHQSGSMGRS